MTARVTITVQPLRDPWCTMISNGDKRRERFGNPLNRCRRRDLSPDVIIVSVYI